MSGTRKKNVKKNFIRDTISCKGFNDFNYPWLLNQLWQFIPQTQ